MTERLDDDVLLQSLAYTYDPVGNITYTKDTATHAAYFDAVSVPSADGDYTYDALYRLIAAEGREHAAAGEVQRDDDQSPLPFAVPHTNDPSGLRRYEQSYVLDAIGNLVSMTHSPAGGSADWTRNYTYASGKNHLATTSHSSGTKSYSHDVHGNMTAMPHLAAMEWDYADRLRHVEVTSGQDVWFCYGADGQRVRKVYVHSGLREERIYLGGYEVYRRWVVSPESLEEERETVHISDDARRVCMIETLTVSEGDEVTTPVSRRRFQLDNHLGTACVEVDETGAVISYEEYHPYGTSAYRAEGGDVSRKRYRYNGKERDEETSLYFYGARYYAPWLGRWTAADPAGLVDGVGLYNYCWGSPVGLTDPNGEQGMGVDHAKRSQIPREATPQHERGPVELRTSRGTPTVQAPKASEPSDYDWDPYEGEATPEELERAAKFKPYEPEGSEDVANIEKFRQELFADYEPTEQPLTFGTVNAVIAAAGLGLVAGVLGVLAGGAISGRATLADDALKIPQGLSGRQFSQLSATVRQGAGHLGDDIAVHGSRASGSAKATSDLDLAIRVSPEKFDELVRARFGSPNPGCERCFTRFQPERYKQAKRGSVVFARRWRSRSKCP
jgi:RHS repeat-associated protein